MNKAVKTTIKYLLIVLGFTVLVDAIYISTVSNGNLGLWLTYAVGIFLVFCGIFSEWIVKRVPGFMKYFFSVGFTVYFVFVLALYGFGSVDTVDYEEDALVILGAGIRGETVSQTLKNRLDAAIDYHKYNPESVIVVSGGQGSGEAITEAEAMERYLIANGIPEDKILQEDQSTSTEENFNFSKAILDEHFDSDYRIAYITNDFHTYRASLRARFAGFNESTHCHADTPFTSILPNGLREVLGVMEMWVFG